MSAIQILKWCALSFAIFSGVTCAADANQQPSAHTVVGFAKYEMSKWLLVPCAGPGAAPDLVPHTFIDATPDGAMFKAIQKLWRKSMDPTRGVYVEFAGYLENDRYVVQSLQRAIGWVESCARRPVNVPAGASAWAIGNEPSWNLLVAGKSASFHELGLKSINAATTDLRNAKGARSLEMMAPSGKLRVEFSEHACDDPMSEAAYGYSVIVATNGKLFAGCGLLR